MAQRAEIRGPESESWVLVLGEGVQQAPLHQLGCLGECCKLATAPENLKFYALETLEVTIEMQVILGTR